jgi:hypothetical protein
MSTQSWPGNGAYSNFFQTVAAGAVAVPGAPAGSAGSLTQGHTVLSSTACAFTVGQDTKAALATASQATLRKFMPARPASDRYARVPAWVED